ncbi:hypothetical protein DC31_00230 [Microbacterium sp. CH12i]|uniref:hypothetical protein n=1 Tax=Microbacterium sp. CH12i TaxID=1479651 RepID=UPI000461C4A7|nr:hypothetical protein [Microbacterium sp. CH12i]KDA07184.1 hypothetical protein DC31_00230 [Microbacterium sp. CH12i]
MSIIYLTSTSGAPGVSTLAAALTLNWPRPALLLEADVAKTSHLLAGYLRGQYKHTHSLTEAAIANLRGGLDGETLFGQTISLGEGRYAIPGFSDIGGARGTTSAFWANMLRAIDQLPTAAAAPDLDIIVDAGRFVPGDPRGPIIAAAEAVLLVTGTTLPDIHALYAAEPAFMTMLEQAGHADYLKLVLTKSPLTTVTRYTQSEISPKTGLAVAGALPWDPAAASHYSHGAAAPSKRSGYTKALADIISTTDADLAGRRYTPTGQD